ncbi:MAG: peptidase, partial [Brevundimonas diminuta]
DITDVTARVQKAGEGLDGQAYTQAREAEAGRIETEACGNDPKIRCQVVSLYRGGQFKLYKFRKYSDVRLAWAPEDRAATFGGDLDNFSFPRFAIDAAFIRLYEDGKPAATPTHFTWNPNKPTEGEPVFVTGNPGSTQRLLTQAQLMTIRDVVLPLDQLIASELRGRLIRYSEEGEEQAFIAMDPIVGVENTYKRGRGRMAALIDPAFMDQLAGQETVFHRRVAENEALSAEVGDPWAALAEVQPIARELYAPMALLEGGTGMGTTSVAGGSPLFSWARAIVRGAQERAKPSDQRLPEFADSRLPGVQSSLFAERPTYPELEQIRLEWWLSKTREWLTVDSPYARTLLGKESPEALSARLIEGTRLADPAVRRALWEGGLPAVQASTGTLRLTYGRVEGTDVPGQRIPAFTTFAGLWDRATGAEPFNVAPKLLAAKDRIDPSAVMNMAVSSDTIGGSSGSPAVNAKGEIIGANFDSTVLTQRNAYGYDRNVNRSVIVTTQAVTTALRDVYDMDHLLSELGVQ